MSIGGMRCAFPPYIFLNPHHPHHQRIDFSCLLPNAHTPKDRPSGGGVYIHSATMTIPHDISQNAPEDVETLRRKLGFRAWHRGTREADLLIGSFADRYLATFDEQNLRQFESLLAENDPDIYDWMTGQKPEPPEHRNVVFDLLVQFRIYTADE
jgi:antitoxin CptB